MSTPIRMMNLFPLPHDLEDDYGSIFESDQPEKRYFPDTYLDSPILITQRTRYLASLSIPLENIKNQYLKRLITGLRSRIPDIDDYQVVDPDEYPVLYRAEWGSTLGDDFDDATQVASSIYEHTLRALAPFTKLEPTFQEIPVIGPDARQYYHRWSLLDSLTQEIERQFASRGSDIASTVVPGKASLHATKDVVFFSTPEHGRLLLTYDQFLMLKDVLFTRAHVLTAVDVLYPNNAELLQAVHRTFQWHEECLRRHGNEGFEILRQSESLSKAYLSQMTDSLLGDDGPYLRMIEKVRKKERALGTKQNFLADDFNVTLRQAIDVQTVVEMFGLLKVSGHPIIDPERGGRSAADEARSEDQTFHTDACRISWEFQRVMLESYVRRHGCWPPLQFSDQSHDTQLYGLYKRQYRGINRTSYPLSDWAYVRWGKIVEFDYAPNYLDLLDDKAISLYRTNIASTWNRDVKPLSHRRLLLELISRGDLDIRHIVSLVVTRQIPFDWLIVSLHPKEREFKLAPRMFSMLVLEIRVFFALTEANLADHIFPYLPQQTMTKDRQVIMKQFLQMTAPQTDTDALTLFLEIDLSRWNLRWRQLVVHMVGRTLNDMFGVTGVFDYVHEFFSQAMIVVRVNDLPPTGINEPHPPESNLLWYNHLGGFEGICQKLWTICTYAMVALAVIDLPLSYILVGQGDNQVLSVRTPRVPDRADRDVLITLRDTILERVRDECAKVNQEMKPEECLESTSVVTYSKDVFVGGVYRPTSLKFHSRLFPHSSQTFPSVRTNIGAIFSTAVAGAEKSLQPLLSYYLACLQSSLYLNRISTGRGIYGQQVRQIRQRLGVRYHDWVTFVLTLPSELGGYPIIPFLGFTYKGGSDPLGKSISAVVLLARVKTDNRLYNRMAAQLDEDAEYQDPPDPDTLLADPFSIPLRKPMTAIDGVAEETINVLSKKIKTTDIRELMSKSMEKYTTALTGVLGACRPFNPLILRDMLECSVAGVTETVSKMFVATRTLQSVVRDLGVPIVDKVLHLESRGLLYLAERFLRLPGAPWNDRSVFRLTCSLRARWHPTELSPIVGVTTHQPWDFDVDVTATGFMKQGINAVLVARTDPFQTRGPYDPYVGSKTREKRSEHGYKIVGTDSASRAMRKLQLIASQTGSDKGFLSLIDAIGWTRTRTTLSTISHLLPGISGGTLSHRYAARAGHLGAYNIGSPNFFTHCVVSSDNAGVLSGGLEDYPVMLQEPLLWATWLLQYRTLRLPPYSDHMSGSVTILIDGTEMSPLPSTDILAPKGATVPILNFRGNKLAYLDELSLTRVSGVISHRSLPVLDDLKLTPQTRLAVLEAFFRGLLRSNSVGRVVADDTKAHFPGKSMDIAELVSNGLQLVIRAIVNVCTDEAVVNFMMTNVFGKARWRLDTFIMKTVPFCVQAVGLHLGHPLLRTDKTVHTLNLYDQPTYSGGEFRAIARLTAYITSRCVTALGGIDPSYRNRSYCIFSSDADRSASELLTACLITDLYIFQTQGIIPVRLVRTVIGRQLLPAIRNLHLEEDRISAIIYVAANVANHLSRDLPDIARPLRNLSDGKRVLGYKIAVEDAMKATRNTTVIGRVAVSSDRVWTCLPRIRSLVPRDRICHHAGVLIDGVRVLDDHHVPPHIRMRTWLYRNVGRYELGGGTSTYSWAPFGEVLARRPLIIIGSGHGAAARVALDAGCPYVLGLDLRSAIPLRAHRFRSYQPPLVAASQYSDNYVQLAESFTTSGDWFMPEVQDKVLQYDAGDYTVVVDIELPDHRPTFRSLEPILARKTSGLVIVRLFATGQETQQLCADLDVSGVTFSVYDIDHEHQSGSRIFVLSKWARVLKISRPCYHPYTAGEPAPRTLRLENTVEGQAAWSVSVADALFNIVHLGSTRDLVLINNYIHTIALDIMGDYDSRLSYRDWSRLLQACITTEWLICPPDKALERLIHAWTIGHFTVHLGGNVQVVPCTWHLIRHLCTAAARLRQDLHPDTYR